MKCALGKIMQYYAAISASIGAMAVGITIGWISPTMIKFTSDNPPIPVTYTELSWIINLQMIGAICTSPLAGMLAGIIGRKYSILISTGLHIASWLMIANAKDVWMMYVARILVGSGSGFIMSVSIMYIGEIIEAKRRGMMIGFFNFMFNLGLLWSFCVGPYVTMSTMAYISLTIPLLHLCTFIWVPESPYYYEIKGKDDNARTSLETLRGTSSVDEEFKKIKFIVENELKTHRSFLQLFKDANNRKALFIVLVLIGAKQLTGSEVFLTYNETIFEKAGGEFSSSASTIIVGVVYICALIIALTTVDKFGRKPMLIFSSISGMIMLVWLGIFFYLKEFQEYNTSEIQWMPLTTMIILFIVQCGLTVVPTVYQSELFTTDFKSSANSITNIALNIYAFVGSEMFLLINFHSYLFVIFWIFAILCGLTAIFTITSIPETKGKSFDEIQKWFVKR